MELTPMQINPHDIQYSSMPQPFTHCTITGIVLNSRPVTYYFIVKYAAPYTYYYYIAVEPGYGE